MCKYKALIMYFSSILSLVFVLSYAKLKEINKVTNSTARQWMKT